jgi:hypothetical protein
MDSVKEACRIILAAKLPPDADPLLIERHDAARRMALSAAMVVQMKAGQADAKKPEEQAEWQKFIDHELAELKQLADRFLEIAPAAAEPGQRHS